MKMNKCKTKSKSLCKHAKQALAVVLTLALMLSLLVLPAAADMEVYQSGDYLYNILEDGTVGISGYLGTETSVNIPSEIEGRTVTWIFGWAFENLTHIINITIPDSINNIVASAFDGTTWLNNQPDGIVYIGKIAYTYKGNMPANTEIILKEGTQKIAIGAFSNQTNLKGVSIPNSITNISNSSFFNCTNLTRVTLTESVRSIGMSAFSNCTSLTDITIPDSVTEIGNDAFYNCTGLTNIIFPNNVQEIGEGAFENTLWYDNQPDGIIYAGNAVYIYKGKIQENADIVINNGTETICSDAFSYQYELTSITIPNSVRTIGDNAFLNCYNLKSINIPDGVTTIGDRAFWNCDLFTLSIPDSVTSIGWEAFDGCTNLTSVTIPSSVTAIGNSAFGYYWTMLDGEYHAKLDNFTVTGYAGTAAEQYAKDNGFKFIALEPEAVPGDATCDGVVTLTDAIIIQKTALLMRELSGQALKNADLNGDGKITVFDAIIAQKIALKMAV